MFRVRLRELREAAGYSSQQAFADAFGVAQSTVGSWEAGSREPSRKMAIRLAQFFGVSLDSLVVGEPSEEDEKKPTPVSEDGLEKEKGEWSTAWDQASPELRRAAMAVLRSAESHPDTQGAAPSDE